MTIGYGTRAINGSCRVATFVLLMQSLTGIFVDALSLGLIFARITDPKHRTRSVFVSVGPVKCTFIDPHVDPYVDP